MKSYLIHCKFDYYCQGTDTTQGDFLVYGENFPDACRKLEQNINKEIFYSADEKGYTDFPVYDANLNKSLYI